MILYLKFTLLYVLQSWYSFISQKVQTSMKNEFKRIWIWIWKENDEGYFGTYVRRISRGYLYPRINLARIQDDISNAISAETIVQWNCIY